MKKLHLIINPVAGKITIRNYILNILKTFNEAGYEVTISVTLGRGEGLRLAQESAEKNYDLVVCCGGDGTFNEVASGILRSGKKITLGYIPSGSTNDFANSIGLALKPEEAALNIVNGETAHIDVGLINNKRHFCYVASFGAFTNVTYSVPQETKNRLGHLAYVLAGVQDLSEIKARKVDFTIDGKEYKGKYIFGAVANSTSIGGMLKIKKDLVDMSDGLFEVMMIHMPNDLLELSDIINALTFSNFDTPLIEFFHAGKVDFRLSKSIDWTVDGEKFEGESEIHIENLHNEIAIMR